MVGWRDGNLYLEAHPALEDDRRNLKAALDKHLAQQLRKRKPDAGNEAPVNVDSALVAATIRESRGFPVRLLESAADAQTVVARARPTTNIVTYPVERDAATAAPAGPAVDAANQRR
jgi:hypothetical protein